MVNRRDRYFEQEGSLKGHVEVVKLLLNRGANIMVNLLLDAHAEIDISNKRGP